MKALKRICKLLFMFVALFLVLIMLCMQFYPEQTSAFIGIRFYSVLTNSMEPRIPTYSLVCSNVIDIDDPLSLKKDDIITFHANRFNEKILITHRFNQIQKGDDGTKFYRTNAEGKTELDMYETRRSDIIGTYLFHIPYLGKVILFLQSKFGLLMYGELIIIWLGNKLMKARWEEKDKKTTNSDKEESVTKHMSTKNLEKSEHISSIQELVEHSTPYEIEREYDVFLSDIHLVKQEMQYYAQGCLHNHTTTSLQNLYIEIRFYDEGYRLFDTAIMRVARFKGVEPRNILHFEFECFPSNMPSYCRMRILNNQSRQSKK